MTTRAIRFTIVVAGLIFFLAGPSFVRLYTDWLWFGELGYQFALATMLRSQGTLFTIVFASMVVWLTLNLRIAVGSLSDARPTYTTPEGFNISLPGRRQFLTIANAGAMLVALLAGLYAASEWNVWMAWRHGVSFGQSDPLLGRDVAIVRAHQEPRACGKLCDELAESFKHLLVTRVVVPRGDRGALDRPQVRPPA